MKGNLIDNIKLAGKLLFYGMKAGDNELAQNSSENGGTEISKHVTVAGPMADLLQQEETQAVKEIRDEYYRIFKEADKHKVDYDIVDLGDGVFDYKVKGSHKKTAAELTRHSLVDESDGLKLRVIQENIHISVGLEESLRNRSLFNYETLVKIRYNDFTPRYLVDKFLQRVVVKEYNNTEAIVDLYFPTMAGQFTKLDAVFIAELNRIFQDKEHYHSEVTDMSEIVFVTEHAWNSEPLCLFKYNNLKFQDISIFDGSFVIKMKGNIVNDGDSVSEKYMTEELTEKYKNKAPKQEATDIFAIDRQIGGINFGTQTLKLDNEDSN